MRFFFIFLSITCIIQYCGILAKEHNPVLMHFCFSILFIYYSYKSKKDFEYLWAYPISVLVTFFYELFRILFLESALSSYYSNYYLVLLIIAYGTILDLAFKEIKTKRIKFKWSLKNASFLIIAFLTVLFGHLHFYI